MHGRPSNSVSATLLDNSSEGSSPQSSVSNEEDVQELLHCASVSGSVTDSKPIYNFSIPDMIRHRSGQHGAAADMSTRRLSGSQGENISQHRRRLRQTLPLDMPDQGANCRPRKLRRLNSRDMGSNAAFIDLTHSPDTYPVSPSQDRVPCNIDLSSDASYRQEASDFSRWFDDPSSRLVDWDDGTSAEARNSSNSDAVPPYPAPRHSRAPTLQHRLHTIPGVGDIEQPHSPRLHRSTEEQQPPLINLDDSPDRSHLYEFSVTPRMVASARQSRLHRRDIINEMQAQLQTQIEQARQARQNAAQAMQNLNQIMVQSRQTAGNAPVTTNNTPSTAGQEEVQFVREFIPRPQRQHVPPHHPLGAMPRRTRRFNDLRIAERFAYDPSLFSQLPSRRGMRTDLFLPYMQFDLSDAPPLHHLAGSMDGSSMEGEYEALWRLAERLGPAKPKGLSKADIEKIPSFRFSSSRMADTNATCVICMSEYSTCEKLRRLCCSHDFHSKCIDKWLKSNKTCPVCRDEVKT